MSILVFVHVGKPNSVYRGIRFFITDSAMCEKCLNVFEIVNRDKWTKWTILDLANSLYPKIYLKSSFKYQRYQTSKITYSLLKI